MSKVGSGDSKNTLYCSFCGKSQHEVRKLIAGPTVFICDECVELCMDIIGEENKSSLVKSRDGIPLPKEIRRPCNDAHAARAGILEHPAFSRQVVPFRLTQSRISVPFPPAETGCPSYIFRPRSSVRFS